MTHDELLAALAYTPHTDPNGAKMHAALCAVVNLHNSMNKYCGNCGMATPCFTIQAIEKELK
jgi:hypothetical protein